MKLERLIQTAAALGLLTVWSLAVYRDPSAVPMHVTWVALISAGFLFAVDLPALVRAWRRRGDDEKQQQE